MKIKFKSNYLNIYEEEESLREALLPYFDEVIYNIFIKDFTSLEELKDFCSKIRKVYSSFDMMYLFKYPDFIYKPDEDLIEIYDFYIE